MIDVINNAFEKDPRLSDLFNFMTPDDDAFAVEVLKHALSKILLLEKQYRKQRHKLDSEDLDALVRCQEMVRNIEMIIDYINEDWHPQDGRWWEHRRNLTSEDPELI